MAAGVIAALIAVIAVRAFRDPEPSPEVRRLLPQVGRFLEKQHVSRRGTLFCSVRYLGNSPPREQFNLYVWELCEDYHADGGRLANTTAWSAPAVIWIVKRGNGYSPEAEYESYTDESIPRMFPKSLRRRIYSMEGGDVVGKMGAEIKRRACIQLLSTPNCKA
jgi:hypothetical protein